MPKLARGVSRFATRLALPDERDSPPSLSLSLSLLCQPLLCQPLKATLRSMPERENRERGERGGGTGEKPVNIKRISANSASEQTSRPRPPLPLPLPCRGGCYPRMDRSEFADT